MTEIRIPTDGMQITESCTLAPGIYVLPQGIAIAADDVHVEAAGVTLINPDQTGVGLRAQGVHNVRVHGLRVHGFYHGLRFDDCEGVELERLHVRATQEIEGIDTFLYLWLPISQTYGGALLLNGVRGGAIRDCDFQHQMNGVLLYHTRGVTVERCNASFNSGWGIYLSGADENLIQDNQLDFCNRVYRRPENGSIRVEADAAAIVLVKGSSRNRFLRNSCLCGGDGVFVAGYEHPGMVTPCNDNLFEDNDCRLSPNNAIESTFSQGNIFRRNDCSRSNYGFWLGYSWDTLVEDNTIEFSRWVGIAIEHGHDNVLRRNQIRLNGEGIRLWTRSAPGDGVMPYWPGFEVSRQTQVEDNTFVGNRIGVAGYTGENIPDQVCSGFRVTGNTFSDNRVGVSLARVSACVVADNRFEGSVEAAVRLEADADVALSGNTFAGNRADLESP
jgi:parallel beta-helix repeat protein